MISLITPKPRRNSIYNSINLNLETQNTSTYSPTYSQNTLFSSQYNCENDIQNDTLYRPNNPPPILLQPNDLNIQKSYLLNSLRNSFILNDISSNIMLARSI